MENEKVEVESNCFYQLELLPEVKKEIVVSLFGSIQVNKLLL